jgi:ubiquinone/menaquinone biosynthesis C-methylase UbiE
MSFSDASRIQRDSAKQKSPSLETLVESEDLGLDILHPGGLDITRELARQCRIGKGTSVLDVASGTGESACFLAEELGARVVGIDGSEYMIERARKKALHRNLDIKFEKADAHQIPFGDGTFDSVISECTVCILDKERAIREMARVVETNGYVGMHDICWKQDTPAGIKNRLAEIEGERPETLDGWKALFEKAGLVDVETVDRSLLIPAWMKDVRKKLGLRGQLKIFLKIARLWGIRGLRKVWESERIFESRYTGYGIIVGRKPLSRGR